MKYGTTSSGAPKLRTARKTGKNALLPNREALARLVGGSTESRSIGNYAKLTPSGRNALSTPDIMALGEKTKP